MGLEMVDIVIGTEDAFGISIKDEDMLDKETVGKYYEYVLSLLATQKGQTRCESSAAFYRIRRALCSSYGCRRESVRPDTATESLLPAWRRAKHWRELGRKLECELPGLRRQRWAAWLVCITVVTALLYYRFGPIRGWSAMFTASAAMAVALVLTLPFKIRVPKKCSTVGDLTGYVVRHTYGKADEKPPIWDRDTVWIVLRNVIAERLCVAPELITKGANFYNDLGAG